MGYIKINNNGTNTCLKKINTNNPPTTATLSSYV